MTHRPFADIVGCSRNAVTYAMHRHGIPSRPRRGVQYPQLQDADWLKAQRDAGRSMKNIADEIGFDRMAVKRALVRLAVE